MTDTLTAGFGDLRAAMAGSVITPDDPDHDQLGRCGTPASTAGPP